MALACLLSEPCSGTGSGPDDIFASVRMRSPFGGRRLIDARDPDAVHTPPGVARSAPGILAMTARRGQPRSTVRLKVPRTGSLRAWAAVAADFER